MFRIFLRPSVWPSLSLWSGLWMANMFFPLKWIQLKQKQWNNMILKWHKSRFLFPSASCRKFESFSKKHRFKISHLDLFLSPLNFEIGGKQHPPMSLKLTGLVWRQSPRSFTFCGFAAPRRLKLKPMYPVNSKDWKVSRRNLDQITRKVETGDWQVSLIYIYTYIIWYRYLYI